MCGMRYTRTLRVTPKPPFEDLETALAHYLPLNENPAWNPLEDTGDFPVLELESIGRANDKRVTAAQIRSEPHEIRKSYLFSYQKEINEEIQGAKRDRKALLGRRDPALPTLLLPVCG